MHGPYNVINENSFIFFISPTDQGKERITRLNEYFTKKTPFSYIVRNGKEGSKFSGWCYGKLLFN